MESVGVVVWSVVGEDDVDAEPLAVQGEPLGRDLVGAPRFAVPAVGNEDCGGLIPGRPCREGENDIGVVVEILLVDPQAGLLRYFASRCPCRGLSRIDVAAGPDDVPGPVPTLLVPEQHGSRRVE